MALAGLPTQYPNGVGVGSNQKNVLPVADASVAVGAEAANAILATVTLKDANGTAVAGAVQAYLSDLSTGIDLIDTAHSTPAVAGAQGVLIPLVAGKAFTLVTNASGVAIVSLTETGAKTAYLVVVLPTGKLVVSGAITHV